MRNRPLCHVSLALACTLALPLASRSASPRVEALQTPPLPAEFADLPESGELSTPVLVSGSVITDDDTRLMGGDAVVVAMPRQEVIEKARGEGTGFNWTPVARATIGRDGSFTARPAPSVDLAENASKGFVDFQLWTRTGDRLGHFGFSRQVTADGELLPATAPDVPLPASDGRPYSLGSSLYGGAPVVQLVTEKAPRTGALGDDSPQPPPNGFDCEHRGQTNARRVAVGQLNHYARGVFGRFSYRVGSHSTMSYGLRVGTELSWHSGGTHTRSTHIEDTFRRTKGLQRYKYFGFWDYGFYLCASIWPPHERNIWQYIANGYAGGARRLWAPRKPETPFCTQTFPAGHRTTITRIEASTFTNGVDVSPVIGIDLSSQSGYDEQTKLSFHFTVGNRRLCGTKNQPVEDRPGSIAIRRGP